MKIFQNFEICFLPRALARVYLYEISNLALNLKLLMSYKRFPRSFNFNKKYKIKLHILVKIQQNFRIK